MPAWQAQMPISECQWFGVATDTASSKAPTNRARLRERVEELVLEYFTNSLDKLPRRSTGSWLPLP